MPVIRPKDHFIFICVVLTLVTAALYWPITTHPFVSYDDEQYVTINPHVTSGLSWTNTRWAFENDEAANWHPALPGFRINWIAPPLGSMERIIWLTYLLFASPIRCCC